MLLPFAKSIVVIQAAAMKNTNNFFAVFIFPPKNEYKVIYKNIDIQ